MEICGPRRQFYAMWKHDLRAQFHNVIVGYGQIWFDTRTHTRSNRILLRPSVQKKKTTLHPTISDQNGTSRCSDNVKNVWKLSKQQQRPIFVSIWGFPYMGVPQNRWFIMENPTKIRMIGGYPYFRKPPCSWAHFRFRSVSFSCLTIHHLSGPLEPTEYHGVHAFWTRY